VTRSIRVLVLLGGVVAGSLVWPAEASAQRRAVYAPRARTYVYVGAGRYYYPHRYYSPFYYRPFYAGWYGGAGWYGAGWYGAGWYGAGPYYWPPYPAYYGGWYDNRPAARIQVKPREAQVYVNGYFVGTVDDFDGVWQRLHLPPGEHELTLYLEGYRTFTQKVLFRPATTLKINHELQPLAAGEANEPRPTPSGPPPERRPVPSRGRDRDYEPPAERRADAEGFGELSLRVQPADAVVTIDGERWDSPEGGSRLQLQLSEGPHRIEVSREGHRPYTTTVEVRRGETATLNVSLPRNE
jgi:PEGA domain